MYNLIQSTLTTAAEFVALAGISAIVVHALYSWHMSQIPTAPKVNPNYQRSELVAEVLETLRAEAEQAQVSEFVESLEDGEETTEPEELALVDPWQTEITISSPRYWVQSQSQVQPQPTLFLLPPAKEAKQSKTRKTTTKPKAPTKKQTTRKRKAA